MPDIEIKVYTREEEEQEEEQRDTGDESPMHKILDDHESTEDRVDNSTDIQKKRSIDHHDPIWKKALAHVEFQGDNDEVFTFDGSQKSKEDMIAPRNDGSEDGKVERFRTRRSNFPRNLSK